MQDGAARPRIILDVKLLMQTQRILVRRRLERALTLVIALALVFAGLCIYVYLVEVYESHWVSNRFLSCQCTSRGFSSPCSPHTFTRHAASHLRVICRLIAGPPGVSTTFGGHPSNHRQSPDTQKRSNRTPGSPHCQLTPSRRFSCCRRTDMRPALCTFLSPQTPPPHTTSTRSRSRFRRSMSRKRRCCGLTRGPYTRCAGGIRVNMASASL